MECKYLGFSFFDVVIFSIYLIFLDGFFDTSPAGTDSGFRFLDDSHFHDAISPIIINFQDKLNTQCDSKREGSFHQNSNFSVAKKIYFDSYFFHVFLMLLVVVT